VNVKYREGDQSTTNKLVEEMNQSSRSNENIEKYLKRS
jgi:hypothetical protein